MAQVPYAITSDDVNHANSYLASRLYLIEYQENVSASVAAKRFMAIAGSKAERAEQLQQWCDMLTEREWRRLRLAIRKRRQRAKEGQCMSSMTVSTRAKDALAKIAIRDGVTLSQALEQVLRLK